MKYTEMLDALPPETRERFIGRIEGMTMAMRTCRIRAADVVVAAGSPVVTTVRHEEAEICVALIRSVQVQIGSGRQPFGELTNEEVDEITRIF